MGCIASLAIFWISRKRYSPNDRFALALACIFDLLAELLNTPEIKTRDGNSQKELYGRRYSKLRNQGESRDNILRIWNCLKPSREETLLMAIIILPEMV